MSPQPFSPSSSWFASLVALLVALGAATLLESVIPAGLGSVGNDMYVGGQWLWVSDIAIRFGSFTLGGYVSVLLARALSTRLIVLLLVMAILGTVFSQFPGRAAIVWLVIWSVSAPLGILLGAWVASARRSNA